MGRRAAERRQVGGNGDGRESPAERLRKGLGALRTRADLGAERMRGAAREWRRSPALQHALAAQERGNLEAAFWLFAEEYDQNPDDRDVVLRYWNVAVALQRVDLAATAGIALVQQLAAEGDLEPAAQHWVELVGAVPDALVPAPALARLLPALNRRLTRAQGEERPRAQTQLRCAMRHAVDPRNEGLGPGVALRIFEEGHAVNPEAARCAAEVALASPNLHEAKRTRLREWLRTTAADVRRDGGPGSEPDRG